MKTSFKIFTIRGIDVRIHLTLLILFLFPVTELAAYETLGEGVVFFAYTFFFLLALFSSVLAHELAHSFVALKNGISVKKITLWPLGGIASVGSVEDAVKELKMTLAGPLTSLAIGFFLLSIMILISGADIVADVVLSGDVFNEVSLVNFGIMVAYLNLVLGAFNLFLPIFPMDGGRVLRAMLALVTDRMTATKWAVRIGQGFLAVFLFFAVMVGSIWLIFIGVFLFIAGLSELKLTELGEKMKKADLKEAVRTDFLAVSPQLTVKDLLKVASPEQNLYPVLESSGKPLGYVMMDDVKDKDGTMEELMNTNFPRVKLDEKGNQLLSKVYSEGFAFVLDGMGLLYGILTADNLQKALSKA